MLLPEQLSKSTVSVRVGNRLYVPRLIYNQTLTDTVATMVVYELDTGEWHYDNWCKEDGPGVDCLLWAMDNNIYALGHQAAGTGAQNTRGDTAFQRYDTDTHKWYSAYIPHTLGGFVKGTTTQERHPFPDSLSLQPSDNQCTVAVVAGSAYVFLCSEQRALAWVAAYTPRLHKGCHHCKWRFRTYEARCSLHYHTQIGRMLRAKGGGTYSLTSSIVCGRYIVLVSTLPVRNARFPNPKVTTYLPVFDTISSKWQEWNDLGIDNHVVQAESGLIVYTQREKNRQHVFSQAEVDHTLLYPDPDLRWAQY
ncbi:hypothetical protein KIPB_001145 [Kipferlia bialata]|uniref:Uncharacterized protein n=1 Tax=Kipferlia bialata TaxID=797122 RepID=A0A391NLN8_9EUKA|nr:hypothetical protein KIPB_001145 [Kipferlia bialata]|eukprot:g1145.t1